MFCACQGRLNPTHEDLVQGPALVDREVAQLSMKGNGQSKKVRLPLVVKRLWSASEHHFDILLEKL